MPLLPQGPPPGGGLAMPQGPPQGLMPPPPQLPPAAGAIQALAPLVPQQQQIMDLVRQKLAEQSAQAAMAGAMDGVAQMPNPVAEAAQTEPSPPMDAGASPQDLQSQGL